MKTRFSALDVVAIVSELKEKICTGWRVNQVYDCDNRTYLLKLNKSLVQMKKDEDPVNVDEEVANKLTLVIESGIRIHTTDYDWNKSHAPSNFAVKLRKHLRNKRIVDIRQVGVDRMVEMQFGSNEAAHYLIIELYDKGNIILTDYQHNVLTILRWRRPTTSKMPDENEEQLTTTANLAYDSENLKVGQPYLFDKGRKREAGVLNKDQVIDILSKARSILFEKSNYKKRNKLKNFQNDNIFEVNLKDLFNPFVLYGSSLLEDKILTHVFDDDPSIKRCTVRLTSKNDKLDQNEIETLASKILKALEDADSVMEDIKSRTQSPGYLVQKYQNFEIPEKTNAQNDKKMVVNIDFFPILSCVKRRIQLEPDQFVYEEFESFDKAVDIYYSNLESQKLDSKAMSVEKEALKKLDNLKLDHQKRLDDLSKAQKEDEEKARLIEVNSDKVESALLIIRSMVANQIPWTDIWETVKEAQSHKDPIASLITAVKFDRNEFSMKLTDPYEELDVESKKPIFRVVDIDLSLSAYANARKFFTKRRTAVNKEQKTKEVSKKAYKNVEKRTKEMLKENVVKTNITKARKRYWFENFHWFISSDGYLVVAGRDAEQNELLVKRYMKNNDIYVHADLHGAATVIIKNEFTKPIPPKTLTEAGTMAVCYSSAWDAKIAIVSWWVYPKQVSKSAPTGEYLTVGAFIIRGKKNYLPVSYLILGFGFLFRLDEESIERRRDARIKRESMIEELGKPLTVAQDLNKSNERQQEQEQEEEQTADLDEIEDDVNVSDNSSSNETIDQQNESVTTNSQKPKTGDEQEEDEDDADEQNDEKGVEYRIIDILAEAPEPDDILLYAIPVCGPYSALQNYKYKLKVIPGTTKRGKAAKATLGIFLHDKRASQREKDLLRVYKDQDFGRDMPQKVKISAANLAKATAASKKRTKH